MMAHLVMQELTLVEPRLTKELALEGPMVLGKLAAKPLFRDPVHDGAADPVLCWNHTEGKKKEPINIATAAQLAMKPATPMRLGLEISKSGCLNQGRRGAGTMPAGKVLWEELCYRYHAGADYVKAMRRKWAALEKHIDNDIYLHVQEKQATQENDAIIWRDTCVSYFQEFSKSLVPAFSDKVIIE